MPDLTDENRNALHNLSLGLSGRPGGIAICAALQLIDDQQAALNAHEIAAERAKRERPARNLLREINEKAKHRDDVALSLVALAIVEAFDANTRAHEEQTAILRDVLHVMVGAASVGELRK